MLEWWTYSLEDFLMFSPRVYWRLVEGHNEALWPLQLVFVAVGSALLLWPGPSALRLKAATALLAFSWAFVGRAFLQERYASINLAADYLAMVFYAEAVLLAAVALVGIRSATSMGQPWCALALAGYGLLLHPLVAPITGRPWTTSETFGVMPDPTAIVTLGFALLVTGWARWLLLPIPIAYLAISALTLVAMLDAAAMAVVGTLVWTSACIAARLRRRYA
jgi:hypothetical protein